MRLWSIHPKYLDQRGLVAWWREGLLAQAVLRGQTRGYSRHPQLERFRTQQAPIRAIANYLAAIQAEATQRGYNFDIAKVARRGVADQIQVTSGQLIFEWHHLIGKLERRDRRWLDKVKEEPRPLPHPSFRLIAGAVESWEKGAGNRPTTA
jgi:hypothetical protein